MNLTSYHPKRRGNTENKNNSQINIRFVAKTSDIRTFKTLDLMLKHQKWQHCNSHTTKYVQPILLTYFVIQQPIVMVAT